MPTWPADVAPAMLRQPDGISCGPTCVVAARMIVEPGWRPFDLPAEVRRAHLQLTSTTATNGGVQLPWPRALGTPPWALAAALSELTGEDVRTAPARFRPVAAYAELVERVATRPVGVYVGNAWLPRHVVLAVAAADNGDDGASVTVFDPARGGLVEVAAARWREHRVDVAGWSHLWAVC